MDHTPHRPAAAVSRRQLLRWAGAAGALATAPAGLVACLPARRAVGGPKPDPSLRSLGFVGQGETVVGQGGWCWFQAPRMAIDARGVLWAGTSQSDGGDANDGGVVVTSFDLARRQPVDRHTLVVTRQDDHTSPSVLVVDGTVQAGWGPHARSPDLSVARLTADGSVSATRIRRPGAIQAPGHGVAYASAHVVAGVRWLLYRGEQYSWNLLTSPDGVAWTSRGLVVQPPAPGQRPYLHAASDGSRLHLLVTDGNPGEWSGTSTWAGTVDADLSIRDSSGVRRGAVGSGAPPPSALTRVTTGIGAGTGAPTPTDVDHWSCDLAFVDNQPTGVVSRRDAWPDGSAAVGSFRHQFLWVRRLSTGWRVEPLCWAGGELYPNQPDYTGLGAQDPTTCTRVVVSTNVDPVTGEPLVSATDGEVHRELFQGDRSPAGTWGWTALTRDSAVDNLRPVIAAAGAWKVLGWMRGSYRTWQDFDTKLVVRVAGPPPA